MKQNLFIPHPFSAPSRLRVSPSSPTKLDALISAAVTGQIDVRGLIAKETP
jgi:hypothetical protein